ncbi:hypothetical protein BpHYR1_001916 [Brachionus plicatilis]|uniref:Cation channel sperm-associated targeting subunit tau C2 domain-containing protein n=1 Tax=Brachionus plicatilis TaxID=10195 RepID=A0A3M7SD36_BRAPC|nr:hypothetical protein BpHYR1_001916 [Brachionus plicatilis]
MASVKNRLHAEGVLCIHLKRLFNFRTSFKIYNLKHFKVRISYKNQIKESKIIALSKSQQNKNQLIDELKLFSIKIVQDDANDLIHFELIQIVNESEAIKSNFYLNIVDLIRSNLVFTDNVSEFIRTKPKNTVSLGEPSAICSIEFDSCFLYGLFGFGLSNRVIFESEQNQTQSSKYLAYSLFKIVDKESDSGPGWFNSEANFSTHSPDLDNKTKEFPALKKILEKRSNFLVYKSEMKQFGNRIDRLKYLKNLVCDQYHLDN